MVRDDERRARRPAATQRLNEAVRKRRLTCAQRAAQENNRSGTGCDGEPGPESPGRRCVRQCDYDRGRILVHPEALASALAKPSQRRSRREACARGANFPMLRNVTRVTADLKGPSTRRLTRI